MYFHTPRMRSKRSTTIATAEDRERMSTRKLDITVCEIVLDYDTQQVLCSVDYKKAFFFAAGTCENRRNQFRK